MKSETDDDRGGIQSIARAAAVLRALARQQQGMSLGAIAAAVDLPRSTVQRLVQALQQERLVETGGPAGPGVRLGAAVLELAGSIRIDVARLARPHLQALFETVRETVDIARLQGREVRFLDQIVSDQALRAVPRRDVTFAPHCMANGKVLLAAMSDAAVTRLLGDPLQPATARSITSLGMLLDALAEVRRSGFAYDREELAEGICAVATGIAAGGVSYAVSVVVPSQRFEPLVEGFRVALRACKVGIEADLRALGGGNDNGGG